MSHDWTTALREGESRVPKRVATFSPASQYTALFICGSLFKYMSLEASKMAHPAKVLATKVTTCADPRTHRVGENWLSTYMLRHTQACVCTHRNKYNTHFLLPQCYYIYLFICCVCMCKYVGTGVPQCMCGDQGTTPGSHVGPRDWTWWSDLLASKQAEPPPWPGK